MDVKKSYETPSMDEVGSVEGMTLGSNFTSRERDNVYFAGGFIFSFPFGGSKGS